MKKITTLCLGLLLLAPLANAELVISETNDIQDRSTQDIRQIITLNHWPKKQAAELKKLIKDNAFQGKYAVFDMDNTSYQYDIAESLLPYLEQQGVLTRDNIDPQIKIIDFQDTAEHKESLYSYYDRLCSDYGFSVCYPWSAQVFSGLELKVVKQHLDTMMAGQKPITVEVYDGDKLTTDTVNPPKIFAGMTELYKALQDNGIETYIISASNEEVVRMVASDPKYGYNVKPENVFGVNVLLKNEATKLLTTSHLQIESNSYDPQETLNNMKFTSYVVSPTTWYEGKHATIVGHIDQWKKPLIVAGDAVNDAYMLFNSTDVKNGGVRIWVDRKAKYTNKINAWKKTAAAKQKSLNQEVTADKNWITVKPNDLHMNH